MALKRKALKQDKSHVVVKGKRRDLVDVTPKGKREVATGWTADPRVIELEKQARQLLSGSNFAVNVQELRTMQMERIRYIGKLTYASVNNTELKRLTEAQLTDMSYRSRIAQMIVDVMDSSALLTDGLSLLRRHLKSTYAAELKEAYGALTNVDAAIESHFNNVVAANKAAERFIAIANEVIRDIDQGSYTYQRMIATASLILGPGSRGG